MLTPLVLALLFSVTYLTPDIVFTPNPQGGLLVVVEPGYRRPELLQLFDDIPGPGPQPLQLLSSRLFRHLVTSSGCSRCFSHRPHRSMHRPARPDGPVYGSTPSKPYPTRESRARHLQDDGRIWRTSSPTDGRGGSRPRPRRRRPLEGGGPPQQNGRNRSGGSSDHHRQQPRKREDQGDQRQTEEHRHQGEEEAHPLLTPRNAAATKGHDGHHLVTNSPQLSRNFSQDQGEYPYSAGSRHFFKLSS